LQGALVCTHHIFESALTSTCASRIVRFPGWKPCHVILSALTSACFVSLRAVAYTAVVVIVRISMYPDSSCIVTNPHSVRAADPQRGGGGPHPAHRGEARRAGHVPGGGDQPVRPGRHGLCAPQAQPHGQQLPAVQHPGEHSRELDAGPEPESGLAFVCLLQIAVQGNYRIHSLRLVLGVLAVGWFPTAPQSAPHTHMSNGCCRK